MLISYFVVIPLLELYLKFTVISVYWKYEKMFIAEMCVIEKIKTIPLGTGNHTYHIGLEINERHKFMKWLREHNLQGKARHRSLHTVCQHTKLNTALWVEHTCVKRWFSHEHWRSGLWLSPVLEAKAGEVNQSPKGYVQYSLP